MFAVKRHTGLARLFWSFFPSLNSTGRKGASIRGQKRDPGILIFFLSEPSSGRSRNFYHLFSLSHRLRPEVRKRVFPAGVAERATRATEGQEGRSCHCFWNRLFSRSSDPSHTSESLKSHHPHPHVLLPLHHAVTLQWRWNSPASPSAPTQNLPCQNRVSTRALEEVTPPAT